MKRKFFKGPLSEIILNMNPLTESAEGQLCGGFAGLSPNISMNDGDIINPTGCTVNINCPCPGTTTTVTSKGKSITGLFI